MASVVGCHAHVRRYGERLSYQRKLMHVLDTKLSRSLLVPRQDVLPTKCSFTNAEPIGPCCFLGICTTTRSRRL